MRKRVERERERCDEIDGEENIERRYRKRGKKGRGTRVLIRRDKMEYWGMELYISELLRINADRNGPDVDCPTFVLYCVGHRG